MMGGLGYREQIVDSLETCHVCIPIINKDWAESGECSDEFSHARRTNLISHKIGKTKPPQPRQPVILPIFFNTFDFLQYKDIRLLASSVNFLPLDINAPEPTWKSLIASIVYLKIPELQTKYPVTDTSSNIFTTELSDNLKDAFASLSNDITNNLTSSGGTYILTGKTINDYDQNTTTTDRCLLTFSSGKVTGTIDYKAGTRYNSSEVAPIDGTYDLTTGKTCWIEIYHHGSSHFQYNGLITGNSIKGTYFWKEKPTATGTFEFTLERWL